MTPARQLCKHDPARGSWGDCFRTAIAVILDLPPAEVPHVFHGVEYGQSGEAGHAAMEAWLNERGLTLLSVALSGDVTLQALLKLVGGLNPGRPYMMGGESRPGCGHFVVCRDAEIVCDPAGRDGLIGPMDDGLWWLYFLGAKL